MNKKTVFVVGGIVLAAALAAGIAAGTGSSAGQHSGEAYGTIQIQGTALPPVPSDGSADPAIGSPAPTIVGDTVSVEPGGGTPMLVMFLAHWCPHCQREVPRVVEWVKQNGKPDGVGVISVATQTTASQGNYPPGDWLDREGWPFPIIFDDESSTAWSAYGAGGFPYWVVIDRDGNVAGRFSGELPDVAAVGQLFSSIADL